MYTVNTRNQHYLCRYKGLILLSLLFLLGSANSSFAQSGRRSKTFNLPHYGDRWLHYGFALGAHSSNFKIKYSDAYLSEELDTLHSVVPVSLPGFKVSFVSNMKLAQYLDFRALITVSFYEYQLNYRTTGGEETKEIRDPTLVEFPLLFKYRSVRRGNSNMYVVGGVTPFFQAAARGEDKGSDIEKLETKNFGVFADVGFGIDIYNRYFKFAPELRYSFGLTDMLDRNKSNAFSLPLNRATYHNITLFLTFEGGPS